MKTILPNISEWSWFSEENSLILTVIYWPWGSIE